MPNVRQTICILAFLASGFLATKVESFALIASILLGTMGMFLAFGQDALRIFSTLIAAVTVVSDFKIVPINSIVIFLISLLGSFLLVDVRILGSPIISTFLFWAMSTLVTRGDPDKNPEIKVYTPFIFAGIICGTLLRELFT